MLMQDDLLYPLLGGRWRSEGRQRECLRQGSREERFQRGLRRRRLAERAQLDGFRLASGSLLEHPSAKGESLESARPRPNIAKHGKRVLSVAQGGGAHRSGAGRGTGVELLPALGFRQRPEKLLFGLF